MTPGFSDPLSNKENITTNHTGNVDPQLEPLRYLDVPFGGSVDIVAYLRESHSPKRDVNRPNQEIT